MSKTFDEQFYTDDFDQEMLDFIKQGGMFVGNMDEWCTSHAGLYYGTGVEGFWTDDDPSCSKYHYKTKQEFKQLIGMVDSQPTYTKSELSCIAELEDRVSYLESLCSDYVSEIEQLRGVTIKSEEFKPISEMTIEDWAMAMAHAWEFETRNENLIVIERVMPASDYPVRADGISYTIDGYWHHNGTDEDDIVKRIK